MTAPPLLSFRAESAAPGAVGVDLDRLVASRALITGNSGAGKSTLLRYVLEQTHGRIQQIVLDPEGEFPSLRERLPYVLAGGADADVPADPKTAKLLCRRRRTATRSAAWCARPGSRGRASSRTRSPDFLAAAPRERQGE